MKHAHKAAAESEAQCSAGLRFKRQGCIVEAKLLQPVSKAIVIVT